MVLNPVYKLHTTTYTSPPHLNKHNTVSGAADTVQAFGVFFLEHIGHNFTESYYVDRGEENRKENLLVLGYIS